MLFKGENVENSKNYLKLERFGDRIAIKSLDGKTLTYTELAHSCDVFAQRFPTDRKCLIVHAVTNERASIIALYAMLRAGHAVLLSEAGNRAHTDRLIEQYDPDFVIEGDCVTERPSTKDRPVLHPDLAWIINTSGSTGSSKGVRLSSEAIAANGRDISNYLKLTSDDCALLTLPLHYCYGLSVLNSHFRVGATVVDGLTSASDGDFEAVLRDLEVTNFPAVPYTIELLESQGFRSWDLPNLRLVTQAGGRLSPDLVTHYARWARDGASDISRDFFVMYGATEATSRMAYMTTEDALRTPDAVGRAIPNGSFEIVDEQGAPLTEAGQAGELVYRGPNLMMGYAHDRGDLSLSAEISSLQTGDIAEWTSDGLVRIVGRVSRFSKIFGKRQNLDDIEERLHRAGYSAVAVSDDRMLFLGVENAHHIDEVAQSASENFEIPAHLIAVSHVDPMPRFKCKP
ncbi:MAG: AMP-binding protein [Pseudomonadota bacterium]